MRIKNDKTKGGIIQYDDSIRGREGKGLLLIHTHYLMILWVLLLLGFIIIIIIVLLFIEGEISKGNRLRSMKHTVSLCDRAYIRKESECLLVAAMYPLSVRDVTYMNQMWWDHPESTLQLDERDRSRIYWKLNKL